MLFRMPMVSAALAAVGIAGAQSSVPSTAPVQAIKNARIEIGNGTIIEKGNLVMRDGIIVAVGAEAPIPPGAQVLDGTGLTVYPGFIDAYTTKGVVLPAPVTVKSDYPSISDYSPAFMLEENRKGIHPEIEANTVFQPTDDILNAYRSAGFTSALVVPTGYIGGIAQVINLGEKSPQKSTLRTDVGVGVSFQGGQGPGYPGSLLGAVAHIRQAFADATTYQVVGRAYQAGGTSRPPFDSGLQRLAASRSIPTLFEVSTAAEIDRIFRISDEFGLVPTIVGGSESWRRLDEIKRRNAAVVVQLNFGPEPKGPPPPPTPRPANDPPVLEEQDSEERIAERKRVFAESVGGLKSLADQGVPLALTTKGNRDYKEFMESLRRVVAAGLSRQKALSALTTDAARLFKLDARLGTLEVGKIANVAVFTGDFLDEKAKVKMIYIDGLRFDPEASNPAPLPRRRFGEGEHE